MTPKDLMIILDCSPATAYNKLNNRTEFTMTELIDIASYYDCTIDQLVTCIVNGCTEELQR